MITYKILASDNGLTARKYLETYHISKTKSYKLFLEQRVYLNDKVALETTIVHTNDTILVEEELVQIPTWKTPLNIIYEDDDVLAVYKPKNVLVHDDGNTTKTLSNGVSFYFQSKGEQANVRCLHRLDKDTSGIVIFPKHMLALSFLSYQMENNLITKEYLAIVRGKFSNNEGIIVEPIGSNRHLNNTYVVSKTGKPAETNYQVLSSNNNLSLLKVTIKTGRTHQIRVHLQHIGHPIVGDSIYGKDKEETLKLLAYKITFIHPCTKKPLTLNCQQFEELKL